MRMCTHLNKSVKVSYYNTHHTGFYTKYVKRVKIEMFIYASSATYDTITTSPRKSTQHSCWMVVSLEATLFSLSGGTKFQIAVWEWLTGLERLCWQIVRALLPWRVLRCTLYVESGNRGATPRYYFTQIWSNRVVEQPYGPLYRPIREGFPAVVARWPQEVDPRRKYYAESSILVIGDLSYRSTSILPKWSML